MNKSLVIIILIFASVYSVLAQNDTLEQGASTTETPAQPSANKTSEETPASIPPAENKQEPSPREEESPATETVKEKTERENFKKGLSIIFSHENLGQSDEIGQILATHYMVRVRIAAALALGRMSKGEKYLHKAIDSDGELVVQSAYEALGMIGARSSVPWFIRGVKNSDIRIRAASLRGLGKARDYAGYDLAHEHLRNSDHIHISAAAIEALGHFSKLKDLQLIQGFLSSPSLPLQKAAIQSLSVHNPPQAAWILSDEYPTTSHKIAVLDGIAGKNTFLAGMLLLKALYSEQDTGLRDYTRQLLLKNKFYGKFALLPKETIVYDKAGGKSGTLLKLQPGSFVKISRQSDMRYALDINGNITEEYFYKVQIPATDSNQPVNGWVFGTGLEFININAPAAAK